jgi:predicted RND superfamily exporter protein
MSAEDHDRTTSRTATIIATIVRWTIRWRWLVVPAALLLVGLSVWRASHLRLRTDLVELLPQDGAAVSALQQLDKRFPSLASVMVVVESPDPASNQRFVDDLVPRLRALPDPEIAEIEWGVREVHDFYRRNAFLYASVDELESAHAKLQREILRRKNPGFLDLSADERKVEGDDELSGDLLEKKVTDLVGHFPDDHFATADGKVYGIIVRFRGSLLGRTHGDESIAAIRDVIARAHPSDYQPTMKVGLTGNVVSGLAERHALEDDLKLATTVCALLVGLAMFLYFRSFVPMLTSVVPATFGVVFALAIAELAFGYLNAATAFMASIILGNGINYAIIQAARYEEERHRGRDATEAAVEAVVHTWRPTGIAALAAALAYGALAVTTFRGFSQFGYIGAAGMIFSWAVTVLLLPAVWTIVDRRTEVAAKPRHGGFARTADAWAGWVLRRPGLVVAVGTGLTLAALACLPGYVRDPFEYDFRKLGNQSQARKEIEALSGKLDPIFGRSLSPGVVLVDHPADAIQVKRKIEALDPKHAIVAKTTILDDLLPGDLATQTSKLEILAKIRRLIDRNVDLLDDQQKDKLRDLRPPDDLRAIGPLDLPMSLRRYFTELDGTIGRPVLYFPPTTVSVWDGKYLTKLANTVEAVRLDDGRVIRSSGSGVIFAEMVRAIVHDGPLVTAVALVGVLVLLVGVMGRGIGGAWTMVTLLVGAVWMVGAAAAFDVRINFLNFIALPITFGIGVDYGVNLVERHRQEGVQGIRSTIAATGGAVALCSLTTIIGYGALLLADSHALRSFGAMAILGEVACLTAALSLLPALFALFAHRPKAGECER